MIKYFLPIAWLVFLSCQPKVSIDQIEEISIIPQPASMQKGEGYYLISESTELVVGKGQSEARQAADFLAKLIESKSGMKLSIDESAVSSPDNSIVFKLIDGPKDAESYELDVTGEGVQISASSGAGLFYGVQTLIQLFPTAWSADQVGKDDLLVLPAVAIEDKPRFGWRGYMLDVSRHFFEVEDVKRVIDFMAGMKLNRFHMHLTDDQGWRVEIKKYPKLTSVGAWRVDYNVTDENISNWWGRPVQKPGEEATYGGFYTQQQIKEIVAYAKARHIEVVPEIDIPGHSQAAIAAYPEISCTGGPFYVATGGVYKDNTYCPGKEVTFQFVEDVLGEVMDLFPFNYIHIGGDECNKESWKKHAACQQRIKEENLADEHELQSYFIKRVEKMINARGKNMIGWDEILEGGLAPNATVMSWRGETGGLAAARAGHDVIMTPNKYCYLDLKQGHDDLEPNLGYSYSFLKDAYQYDIVSDSLTEQQGKHVLGVQGNLWTESISDWGKLTYMTFPRLHAIAENAWTPEEGKNWDDFTTRLLTYYKRLDKKGERYATSAYNVWIDHQGKGNSIEVALKTEANGLDIVYTLDGSTPTAESQRYDKPFGITKPTVVKATTFIDGEQIGNVSELYFAVHKAADAKVIARKPAIKDKSRAQALVDLNYAKLSSGDPAWQYFNGDLEFDVVLPEAREVKQVAITTLRFTISGTYNPKGMEVFGSVDGRTFTKLGEKQQLQESLTQGRNKVTTTVDFPAQKLKAIKIKAKRLNPIPEGHHRAGQASKIAVDEIVVL